NVSYSVNPFWVSTCEKTGLHAARMATKASVFSDTLISLLWCSCCAFLPFADDSAMTACSMPKVTGQKTASSRLVINAQFMPKGRGKEFSNLGCGRWTLCVSFVLGP